MSVINAAMTATSRPRQVRHHASRLFNKPNTISTHPGLTEAWSGSAEQTHPEVSVQFTQDRAHALTAGPPTAGNERVVGMSDRSEERRVGKERRRRLGGGE